jgi:acyl-CoA dehydrogenase
LIDFELSDEQKQIQAWRGRSPARRCCRTPRRLGPRAALPGGRSWRAAELGLLNVGVPEEHGGLGLGMLDEVVVAEELAYACMGFYTILMASDLGVTPIVLAGTSDDQQRRFLAPLTEGPRLAAFASRSPTTAPTRRPAHPGPHRRRRGGARRQQDVDQQRRTGRRVVVFATVDPRRRAPRHGRGGGRAGTPGAERSSRSTASSANAPARRPSSSSRACACPANVLGEVGDGFKIAMRTLDRTRVPVAAGSVGVAQRALDEAVRVRRGAARLRQPIAGSRRSSSSSPTCASASRRRAG